MYARAEQSGNILSDIGYDARVLRVSDWQEQEVNDWRSEASGADRAVDHEGRHNRVRRRRRLQQSPRDLGWARLGPRQTRCHGPHARWFVQRGGVRRIALGRRAQCHGNDLPPGWTRHGKAAPFKRNDGLLPTLPIGVLAFPGCSFTENLADKARGLGVPVWRGGRNA